MKIEKIIRASGMRPFLSTYRGNKNDKAHEMMGGKSHYYDDGTFSTRAADKAAQAAIAALDPLAIVRNVFQRKRESLTCESKRLASAARMLPRQLKGGTQ